MSLPDKPVRIASLFPAATELCYVLGAFDDVVAVSHECNFPEGVRDRPKATRSRVAADLPSAELDARVQALAKKGESLFEVDIALLKRLSPDLLLTQGNCESCAVSPKDVEALVKELRPAPQVFNHEAKTFEDVLGQMRRLGETLHRGEEAKRLMLHQWGLAKEIRTMTRKLDRPRVAVLDWIDPLMFAGHWVPELVDMAGGEYALAKPGDPSRRGSWDELEEYEPDVIVAAPCGRSLEQAADELARTLRNHQMLELAPILNGRVFVANGNDYFNRPGPRLIYSAGILARLLHWDAVPALPPPIESSLGRLEFPKKASPPPRRERI